MHIVARCRQRNNNIVDHRIECAILSLTRSFDVYIVCVCIGKFAFPQMIWKTLRKLSLLLCFIDFYYDPQFEFWGSVDTQIPRTIATGERVDGVNDFHFQTHSIYTRDMLGVRVDCVCVDSKNHFKYWFNICNNMPQNPCIQIYPECNISTHTPLLAAIEFAWNSRQYTTVGIQFNYEFSGADICNQISVIVNSKFQHIQMQICAREMYAEPYEFLVKAN